MTLGEYIRCLQNLEGLHGSDVRVVKFMPYAPMHSIRTVTEHPCIAYTRPKAPREQHEKIGAHVGEVRVERVILV